MLKETRKMNKLISCKISSYEDEELSYSSVKIKIIKNINIENN